MVAFYPKGCVRNIRKLYPLSQIIFKVFGKILHILSTPSSQSSFLPINVRKRSLIGIFSLFLSSVEEVFITSVDSTKDLVMGRTLFTQTPPLQSTP